MNESVYHVLVNDRSVLFTSRIVSIQAVNSEEALKKAKITYPSCEVSLIKEGK